MLSDHLLMAIITTVIVRTVVIASRRNRIQTHLSSASDLLAGHWRCFPKVSEGLRKPEQLWSFKRLDSLFLTRTLSLPLPLLLGSWLHLLRLYHVRYTWLL